MSVDEMIAAYADLSPDKILLVFWLLQLMLEGHGDLARDIAEWERDLLDAKQHTPKRGDVDRSC